MTRMLWARKILYHAYRFFSSAKYWLLRRFTHAGLAVLAGIFITATMGFDTDQTNAYQIFTFLFALLLASLAFGWRLSGRFAVTRSLPRFGTAGHPLAYRVVVENLTGKLQNGLVLLENFADPRPALAEYVSTQIADEKALPVFSVKSLRPRRRRTLATAKEQSLPPLPSRGSADVKMEIVPMRRGVLRLEGATIARPDPFGLFKAMAVVPQPQTVLILPKRYFIPSLTLPGTMRYQQGGVALAASVGESEEFVSLRDYRPGDSLRHIHWRSWARTGRPIVKEFQEEFFVRHALVLDTFGGPAQNEVFEEAVSVAASFACAIQTQETLLDLMFAGPKAFCFTAGRGLAHADQMLEILSGVRLCGDQPFESLERLVMQHAAAVSGCIMVLLGWDGPRKQLVHRLQLLGIPLLVLVVAPPGGAAELETLSERPGLENLHVLEVGKVAEGLAEL
jgi:uncharacterized protein (DUF58 family)